MVATLFLPTPLVFDSRRKLRWRGSFSSFCSPHFNLPSPSFFFLFLCLHINLHLFLWSHIFRSFLCLVFAFAFIAYVMPLPFLFLRRPLGRLIVSRSIYISFFCLVWPKFFPPWVRVRARIDSACSWSCVTTSPFLDSTGPRAYIANPPSFELLSPPVFPLLCFLSRA